jgi:hypothetical protein
MWKYTIFYCLLVLETLPDSDTLLKHNMDNVKVSAPAYFEYKSFLNRDSAFTEFNQIKKESYSSDSIKIDSIEIDDEFRY